MEILMDVYIVMLLVCVGRAAKPWDVETRRSESRLFLPAIRWLQVNTNALRVVVVDENPDVLEATEAVLEAVHAEAAVAVVSWKRKDSQGTECALPGGHYVVLFREEKSLELVDALFRSGGEYVLMWLDVTSPGLEIEILRRLWVRHSTLAIVLCRLDPQGVWSSAIFDPFSRPNPSGKRGALHPIGNTFQMENVRSRFARYLRNLRGYPVDVALFAYGLTVYKRGDALGGKETRLLAALQKAKGFLPRVVASGGHGARRHDGSFTLALDDVAQRRAEIALNSRELRYYGDDAPFAWCTHVCLDVRMHVVAPRAGPLPSWSVFFRCFSWEVWSLLAATTLVSGWAWSLLRTPPAGLGSSLAGVAHAITSMAWSRLREVRGVRERAVFAVLLLSCVACVVCFQSVLVNFFTSPPRYPEIDSLKQLDRANLTVKVSNAYFADIFRHRESPTLENLDRKLEIYPGKDFIDHLKDIIGGERMSFVTSSRGIVAWRNVIPNKVDSVHIVPVNLRTLMETYIVRKNSPYVDMFKTSIGSLVESGVMEKWNKDSLEDAKFLFKANDSAYAKSGPYTYTLDNLKPAFVFLGFGLCCSSGILVVEVLSSCCPFTTQPKTV